MGLSVIEINIQYVVGILTQVWKIRYHINITYICHILIFYHTGGYIFL